MNNKRSAVDFPEYDPDIKHLPFPPTQSDYNTAEQREEEAQLAEPKPQTPAIVEYAEELDEQDRQMQDSRRTRGRLPGFNEVSVDGMVSHIKEQEVKTNE